MPTDSNVIKDVYSVYSEEGDMTFIMEDIIDKTNESFISSEVKGFYFGRPSNKDDQYFYGKLKATY